MGPVTHHKILIKIYTFLSLNTYDHPRSLAHCGNPEGRTTPTLTGTRPYLRTLRPLDDNYM